MRETRQGHLPGEEGVWLFVLGDMIMFTALFAVFLYYRSLDPRVFAHSRQALSDTAGLVNTALMLTSSWCVAIAVRAACLGKFNITRRLLYVAIACGGAFGGVKYLEWSYEFRHGFSPVTDNFFMFYFVLTGMHMVHLVIATIILLFLARTQWQETPAQLTGMRNLESGATFWHLVDLLWIILFALLYLLR